MKLAIIIKMLINPLKNKK